MQIQDPIATIAYQGDYYLDLVEGGKYRITYAERVLRTYEAEHADEAVKYYLAKTGRYTEATYAVDEEGEYTLYELRERYDPHFYQNLLREGLKTIEVGESFTCAWTHIKRVR